MHASILPYINVYECLFYAFACVFLSYDLVSTYVMFMRLKLKENRFGNFMFSKPLKLNLCIFTLFIIKLEVAVTTTITH